jgi:hemolysin activation/secretion protein
MPHRFFVVITGLMVVVSMTAQAQRLPDAGTLLREIERTTGKTQNAPAPLLPMTPDAEDVPLPAQAGEKVLVNGFRIDASRFPDAELQALLKEYVGHSVTLAQLQAGTRKISDYYRQRDYLAYAYLPPQTVRDGLINIRVVEATLGQVNLDATAPTRLNTSILRGMVTQRAIPGQPLRPAQLDQAVAILNELPGVMQAQSLLKPGSNRGESDAVIRVEEAPLAQADVSLNNTGSKATDIWQTLVTGSIDSPLGRGDQLRFNLLKSQGDRYLWLGASTPLGASGRRFEVNASALEYAIQPSISPLDLKGRSTTAGAVLTQPLRRSSQLSLTATAGLEIKRMVDRMDEITLGDRQISVGSLGLTAMLRDRWLGGGINHLDLRINIGNVDLTRRPEQLTGDQLTAHTHGSYQKLYLALSREQPVSQRVTMLATLLAQWTPTNLDSSEKFTLGGYYGVRAYPTSEATGDNGWLLNLEMQWQLRDSWRFSGFYDVGWIQQHAQPWTNWQTVANQPNTYQLQGVGLSLRWTPSPLFQAQAVIASAIGDNPGLDAAGHNSDGNDDKYHAWVQMTVHF